MGMRSRNQCKLHSDRRQRNGAERSLAESGMHRHFCHICVSLAHITLKTNSRPVAAIVALGSTGYLRRIGSGDPAHEASVADMRLDGTMAVAGSPSGRSMLRRRRWKAPPNTLAAAPPPPSASPKGFVPFGTAAPRSDHGTMISKRRLVECGGEFRHAALPDG